MTAPIEDVSSLPGKKISDQEQSPIGKIKDIYATDDGYPMWVAVESGSGIADKQTVVIPLARLKDEDGEILVPYSKERILDAPQMDGDGISEELDHELRGFYGIGTGDQELRADNLSYATLVAEEGGAAEKVEDAGSIETPDADTRTDETRERLHDPGSAEIRKVTADDVVDDDDGKSKDEHRAAKDESDHGKDESDHGKNESDRDDNENDGDKDEGD